MLTVQILTSNNENTLEKTFASLKNLECSVIVTDLGSTDSTLEICSYFGAEIIKCDHVSDRSEARNLMIQDGINMMIEPWEYIAKGQKEISECRNNSNVMIVNSNFASKELRIWSGLKFKNPTYEVLEDDSAGFLEGVAIVANEPPDRREENAKICLAWRESRPTNSEAWYYSAFSSLALGEKEEFIKYAQRYLAMTNKFGPAEVQMLYKMAQILASKNDLDRAASLCVRCLATHPTLSEFWCLLGDIFVKKNDFFRAKSMYVNALKIGERRSSYDSHPVMLDKYRKYPIFMIGEMDKQINIVSKNNTR